MPAFYLLLFLGLFLLFFLLSFIYKPLGKIVKSIFCDAIDIMNEKDEESEDNKK